MTPKQIVPGRSVQAVARVLTVLTVAALLVAGLPTSSLAPGHAQQPRRGGVLRVALVSEPPSLDIQATTALSVAATMHHVYEGLFTINSKLQPVPMLAEGYSLSADRLTYTIKLRPNVPFHHGREVNADDVVASLVRWGRLGVRARGVFANVAAISATDPRTVAIRLKEPNSLLITELSWWAQPAVIYPKDVIDETGAGPMRRFIGTGPFRFVEYVPDRHIRLERFDRYAARTEAPDGMSGRRTAYLDAILFITVPDAAVRIAQLQRHEADFAESLAPDDYDRLRRDPNLVPVRAALPSSLVYLFNKRNGVFTNPKVRQAAIAAIDANAILQATYGHPQFFRADPGMMPKEHYMWTDAGKELYNQKNPDLARRLLTEAGYRGEPVRWLVTAEYFWSNNSSQVTKPLLERAGFVVDLQVMDWPTTVARRSRTDGWDVTVAHTTTVPDPTLLLPLSPSYPGWYESRDMAALMTLLRRHSDPKTRMELWRRAQALYYQEAPSAKVGDGFLMYAHRPELKGFVGMPTFFFWNTWMEPRR
jgi:peptide/nickel transport system substrate-binding protein